MQMTNMPSGLYIPEHLYIFRNIESGQLRSIKGTSPPIFTVLQFHFPHSLSLSLYIIPNSEHHKSCPNLEFSCSKAPHFNPCQTSWKVSSISVHMQVQLVRFFLNSVESNPEFVFRTRLLHFRNSKSGQTQNVVLLLFCAV